MVEKGGGTRGVHARRFSAKQRLHFAALLIACLGLPAAAQNSSDIDFDPSITQAEFAKFARLAGQAIYHTPVEPARAGGLLNFDIGVAATAVPVDTSASYWLKATGNDDFTVSDHLVVPRLVVSKGFSAFSISASYAKLEGTDVEIYGGAVDVPIINGGLVKPTLALRGSYSQLQGVDQLDLTATGLELFLSKGFGPITPYAAVGRSRVEAEGRITPTIVLKDNSSTNRYTVGVKLSLLFPKLVVEATQAEERSYAAKVSFGF